MTAWTPEQDRVLLEHANAPDAVLRPLLAALGRTSLSANAIASRRTRLKLPRRDYPSAPSAPWTAEQDTVLLASPLADGESLRPALAAAGREFTSARGAREAVAYRRRILAHREESAPEPEPVAGDDGEAETPGLFNPWRGRRELCRYDVHDAHVRALIRAQAEEILRGRGRADPSRREAA